ncbi:hypothetical protein ACMFMG_007129 [Clarireedia jacksonii]
MCFHYSVGAKMSMRNLPTKKSVHTVKCYLQRQRQRHDNASQLHRFNQHRVSQRLHQKSNLVTRSEPFSTAEGDFSKLKDKRRDVRDEVVQMDIKFHLSYRPSALLHAADSYELLNSSS